MFVLSNVNVLKVVAPAEGKKAFKVIVMDLTGREDKPVTVYVMPDKVEKYKGHIGKVIKELRCRVTAFKDTLQVFPDGDPSFG